MIEGKPMEKSSTRKLCAILGADVKGYSLLMGKDEAVTLQILRSHREVVAGLIQQCHGRVVDSPGDNILAEFGSVVDAVECAMSIQREIKARNAELPEERRMEFRIGVNLGDVIEEDGRIYGDGVNITARIKPGESGGICISETAMIMWKKLPWNMNTWANKRSRIRKPIRVYE
jgi:adenylate cyclase